MIELLWVRPAFEMPNVSVRLTKEDLKLSETLSIEPIIVNAIPESVLEEFKQLQLEFFSALADNAITFDLRETRGLYVEDNILFGSLQFKERRNGFKCFKDYMFLIKDSDEYTILDIFDEINESYEMLINDLLAQLDYYIDETVEEIINNFPELKYKEEDFKSDLRNRAISLESISMQIEFNKITLSEGDAFSSRCLDEAYESAILIESKLMSGPAEILDSNDGFSNETSADNKVRLLFNGTKVSNFEFLQDVAKRILKYNIHEDEDLAEVGAYYNQILKDIDTFKAIDYEELLKLLDDFPDFGIKMMKKKISDAIKVSK